MRPCLNKITKYEEWYSTCHIEFSDLHFFEEDSGLGVYQSIHVTHRLPCLGENKRLSGVNEAWVPIGTVQQDCGQVQAFLFIYSVLRHSICLF